MYLIHERTTEMSGEVLLNGKSLKEFKVSELKAACKERNLPIGGNKSTLIKKLKAVIIALTFFFRLGIFMHVFRLLAQAIELENLQKAARSSPAGGSLPNSEVSIGY